MHELGLMESVLGAVNDAARDAGATKVLSIHLTVGEMTEVVEDALVFAFEALSDDTLCEGAEFEMTFVAPRSRCMTCGHEYDHDRFHMACPKCSSLSTELIAGREMFIDNIEVDIPDEENPVDSDNGQEVV